MANEIGKKYACSKCGAEVVVTKGGEGTLNHCGQPMEQKA
jgi:desulfoferrodoxin-like iron-binding protein